MEAQDRSALERFLLDNPELERLESQLCQFNVFEAVRAVRQELRHSDFLSFLLSPQESHGLRDGFLKRFLQCALAQVPGEDQPISPIELDAVDLTGAEVLRESSNIDILIRDEKNKLVVVIENKIGATEHSDQLNRYWDGMSQQHADWRKIGLYLTPEGEEASHPSFIAVGYDLIGGILERMVEGRSLSIDSDVRTFLSHYTQILRRYVLSDSEIARLCRSIYQKHKVALDLIFEHRPDSQGVVRDILEALISRNEQLILDHTSKGYIRFIPKEWDLPELRLGQGWTESGRMLLFEFQNFKESLKLRLIIGPGPTEVREKLFKIAKQVGPPFKTAVKELSERWNMIFDRPFLSTKDYGGNAEEQLRQKIEEKWKQFLNLDLPEVSRLLLRQGWKAK